MDVSKIIADAAESGITLSPDRARQIVLQAGCSNQDAYLKQRDKNIERVRSLPQPSAGSKLNDKASFGWSSEKATDAETVKPSSNTSPRGKV